MFVGIGYSAVKTFPVSNEVRKAATVGVIFPANSRPIALVGWLDWRLHTVRKTMGLQQRATPTPAAIDAAVALLTDTDDKVQNLCRTQLLLWGESVRPALLAAEKNEDPHLRTRARSLLQSLDLRDWLKSFCSLTSATTAGDECLLEGLLLLNGIDAGGAISGDARSTIARLGRLLEPRVKGRSSHTSARHLASLMSEEFALDGCREGSCRRESVHLDPVLVRRRGLSSVLTAIYVLVARAAGLQVQGVQLIDYFVVRIHGRRAVLLDPFHGGRTVTKADCLKFLRERGVTGSAPEALADIEDRRLLAGVVQDMRRSYYRPTEREYRAVLAQAQAALTL